jgi:hypothetical protein
MAGLVIKCNAKLASSKQIKILITKYQKTFQTLAQSEKMNLYLLGKTVQIKLSLE